MQIQQLEKQVQAIAERLEDLENGGRQNNVCTLGLPEDTDGSNPVILFEKWIPDYHNINTKASTVKLDRALHSLSTKPWADRHPRPVMCILRTSQANRK